MTDSQSSELLALLHDIERRSRSNAAGIPKQEDNQVLWEGVLCTVAGSKVVVPLGEVKEILNFTPTTTFVPGAKDWMQGIANIRGNLLPIIDLQRFLGGSPILKSRRSRVLVINHGDLFAGLTVENVFGMRHFSDDMTIASPAVEGVMREYVDGGCLVDGEPCPVFRMSRLAESTGFQMAAA